MSLLLKLKESEKNVNYVFTCLEYDENNILLSRTHAMLGKDSQIMVFLGIS